MFLRPVSNWVTAWFCMLLAMVTFSAEAAEQGASKKVPTTIQSARMEYDANGQIVIFTGNVHVKRPDFELWAEKMTVYLDKSEQKNDASNLGAEGMEAGDIDRIVAEKKVRLKSENNSGTCEKATYYAKEDKFVMEGNPILHDNKGSTVTGGAVVHYPSTNRSEVLRGAVVNFYAPDHTENGTNASPLTRGKK